MRFLGRKRCLRNVGIPEILRIWDDFQSQPFVLSYLNNSHSSYTKISKLPMPFLQANSEISSSFAARPNRYDDRLTILRLRPATVKSAYPFCRLQPFSGSRQTFFLYLCWAQCLSVILQSDFVRRSGRGSSRIWRCRPIGEGGIDVYTSTVSVTCTLQKLLFRRKVVSMV